MSRRFRPATTEAEAERRRKIGARTAAFWASEEGEALKERMRRERTGVRTDAHKRAMADPEVRRRIADGIARWLDLEPLAFTEPPPVSDEERAAAAAEEGRR